MVVEKRLFAKVADVVDDFGNLLREIVGEVVVIRFS